MRPDKRALPYEKEEHKYVPISRITTFLGQLNDFQQLVGRQLTVYAIGGRHAINRLSLRFNSMVIVESTAYMKTVHRQLAYEYPLGKLRWKKIKTEGSLEQLLDHNIRAIVDSFTSKIAEARGQMGKTQNVAA
jgi:hypothetical protein